MRRGDEGVQALEWTYGALCASQALADALGCPLADLPDYVHQDVAPADLPGSTWVVFALSVPPADRMAVGNAPRIFSQATVDVKAVTQGESYSPLAPVARAIYDTLHGRLNEPVADGMILTVLRTDGIQYPERTDGIQYRHLGHTLQVQVQ